MTSYIEVVEPRMIYVKPLGYEIRTREVKGYVKAILKEEKDEESNKIGTYEELMQSVSNAQLEKALKKKAESMMEKSML